MAADAGARTAVTVVGDRGGIREANDKGRQFNDTRPLSEGPPTSLVVGELNNNCCHGH